jgi:hypothetical protein
MTIRESSVNFRRELPVKIPRVPHGIRNADFKQQRRAAKQTNSARRSRCYNFTVEALGLKFARSRYFLSAGTVGEWLSLVEHLVRDQGVGGSNPLSPTNLFLAYSIAYAALAASD